MAEFKEGDTVIYKGTPYEVAALGWMRDGRAMLHLMHTPRSLPWRIRWAGTVEATECTLEEH